MSRFINAKSNINMICMPLAGGKKFLKISFKASNIHEKDAKSENDRSRNSEHSQSWQNSFRQFKGPERTEKPLNLPRSFSDCISQRARVAYGIPVNSKFGHLSSQSTESKFSIKRFSDSDSSLLRQKVRNPKILTEDLVRKERTSTRFLSATASTGRVVKKKPNNPLLRGKSTSDPNLNKRLSESGKLQLFHALLNKPLPALDLRTRFGITKQSLKGFCRKGLLTEEWGPGTVGLRFRLTRKGKMYLTELKAAARYDSAITKRGIIRLKSKF